MLEDGSSEDESNKGVTLYEGGDMSCWYDEDIWGNASLIQDVGS